MGKSLLAGTIIGGIIVFVWMMISWMAIPWHCMTLQKFSNENSVAETIMENTQRDGVYVLPNMCDSDDNMQQTREAMRKGPVIFASVVRYGYDVRSAVPYILAIIFQWIGAFFITLLVLQTRKDFGYFSKVWFITLIGLTIGVLGVLPNWNWWSFSFGYIGLQMLDLLIGWFLASLAMAAVIKQA